LIASGSFDTTIRVWDALSGSAVIEMWGNEAPISSLVFSPDGRQIVSGSCGNTVRVWDVATGAQVLPVLRGHKSRVKSLFFSPDASRIISLSESERLSWDSATGSCLPAEPSDHRLSGTMYITHDGWIVDSATNRTLGKLPTMVAGPVSEIHGRSFAVGTYSGRVFITLFPTALLTSTSTRVIGENVRPRFKALKGR